jgi:hypothetical protein
MEIMKSIIDWFKWFNSLGWLANIITIGIPIYGIILLLLKKPNKWILKKFIKAKLSMQYHTIFEFIQRQGLENKSYISAKELNILILDDEPQNYPIEYLRNCKYKINHIGEISLSNIDEILDFDLIILDITGIVKEDKQKGGFELLKRLRKEKPLGQAIIAASSKRFDLSVADFYEMADVKIKTPIEGIEMEEVLEQAMKLKFNVLELARKLDYAIENIKNIPQRDTIMNEAILYLDKKGDYNSLSKKLEHVFQEKDKKEFMGNIKSLGEQINHD